MAACRQALRKWWFRFLLPALLSLGIYKLVAHFAARFLQVPQTFGFDEFTLLSLGSTAFIWGLLLPIWRRWFPFSYAELGRTWNDRADKRGGSHG